MEQKDILKLITTEAEGFTIEKEMLEKREKKLSVDADEIKEKLAEAKPVREKDEQLYEEKVAEVRKLADRRKEDWKRVQKEKRELKSKIKKSKEKILAELKENQKEIFENRNKVRKLTKKDIKKLREERKRLYSEIRSDENRKLINTTKAKLKEMSDEDRKKVEQAKQMTKEKKNRITEITKELRIDSGDFFDRLNPQDLFKRNKIIIEKVEETFNFDKIDTLNSEISKIVDKNIKTNDDKKDDKKDDKQKVAEKPKENDKSKQEQQETKKKPEEKRKTQQQGDGSKEKQEQNSEVRLETQPVQPVQQVYPDNPVYNNFPFMGEPIHIGSIGILEKEGIATYNFGNKQGVISLEEVKEDKKAMFKKYGIRKLVGFRASRRVNPAVIKAFEQMENGDQMIGEYLQSIKYKGRFNFNLEHDLSGLNIFQRISRNRQVKREQKCGAIITKKQSDIDYNRIIAGNEQQGANIVIQSNGRQQRSMDSYVNVRGNKGIMDRIEQVEENARHAIRKENQDIVNEGKTQEQGEEITN